MSDIRFLINTELQLVTTIDPNMSVLDYLRNNRKLTGTKEGCASGDCGACTVVLAEVVEGNLEYRAVNACITPLVTLHAKQLLTVEHLKYKGQLHPVQQALVDCHGSQCGFCTPGFVMSLFAYRKNRDAPSRESIIKALGGNLCRCTGYRPIIDAAEQMFKSPMQDQFSERERQVVATLETIENETGDIFFESNGKRYFAPTTSSALADILQTCPTARLVAGGTDLCLEFTQLLREIEVLVYTGRVRELLQIQETDNTIEIGAAVSYSRCRDLLVSHYPDLSELIDRLGSRQIRNQGTIGGNIGNASPIGDMPPALIAINAQLVLRRGDKTRTIPLEEYFIRYKVTARQTSEFIERIILPKPAPGYRFRIYKISKRLEDDISATCGAFYLKLEEGRVADARIAYGGMAETPKRAKQCEQVLLGKSWNQQTVRQAKQALVSDFSPITDFRASARYRLQVSQNLLQRFYLEFESSEQLRVTRYA